MNTNGWSFNFLGISSLHIWLCQAPCGPDLNIVVACLVVVGC